MLSNRREYRTVLIDTLHPEVVRVVNVLVLAAVLVASFVTMFLPFENVYQESWMTQTISCERPCSYGSCLAGGGQVVIEGMLPENQLLYLEARATPPQWWVDRWVRAEGAGAMFFDQRVVTTVAAAPAPRSGDRVSVATERVGCWPGVVYEWEEGGGSDDGAAAAVPGCEPVTLFAVPRVEYSNYWVNYTLTRPFEPFCSLPGEGSGSGGEEGGGAQPGPSDLELSVYIVSVNGGFTRLSVGIKYTLLGCAAAFLLVWTAKLRRLFGRYSREQRWILALLIALLGFNNPLAWWEAYGATPALTAASVVLDVSFLALLLLFWLCVVDSVGRDPTGEYLELAKGYCFYLPKITLCSALWGGMVALFVEERLQTSVDPTWNAEDNMLYFVAYKRVAIALTVTYACYATWLMLKATREGNGMLESYRALLSSVGVTMLIVGVGVLSGQVSPVPYRTNGFVSTYLLLNLHVFSLALAFTPVDRPDALQGMELHQVAGLDGVDDDGAAEEMGGRGGEEVGLLYLPPAAGRAGTAATLSSI